MRRKKGYFIVIEGLDGAGTTTQSRLLYSHLRRKRRSSFLTFEPTDGPAGKLIRDALSGRIFAGHSNRRVGFSERALCLLFAADRLEHSREVEARRASGAVVVCDRYVLSSLAYQTLEKAVSARWVIQVNRGCSLPDLTLLLDVPLSECTRRLKERKDKPTIYEKKSKLARIARNYSRVLPVYRRNFGPTVIIDGTGTPEEVHSRILAAIEARL